MIKIYTEEYSEGGYAVMTTIITLFNIPIFKRRNTTTNVEIVNNLSYKQKSVKVKGFYETKNKNKENK